MGLAGAGAGGPNGTAAALYAVLDAAADGRWASAAICAARAAAPYDTVNMISCDQDACVALTDPGAHGAGIAAEVASQ